MDCFSREAATRPKAQKHFGEEVGQRGDQSRDDDGNGLGNHLDYTKS
jgi:hypothetical protein